MEKVLLDRLETAVARLLEKNRRLEEECRVLRQGQLAWQQERSELLTEVERILARLESVALEEQ
jgi:hypothetical protein